MAKSLSLEFVSMFVGFRDKSHRLGVTPWVKEAFRMRFGIEW